MKSTEFLTERVLNLLTPEHKLKYGEEVWELLQRSYAGVPGGFGTAANLEELIAKSALWKVVTRNGEITAVSIYRDRYGRKNVASGTNGHHQGKLDYIMLKKGDIDFQRAWAEVSGAPEHLMKKSGCAPIPAKFAEFLTKKEILEYNPDGAHYTRLINGEPHEKIIYGTVKLTMNDVEKLKNMGVALHELPQQFKISS